MRHLVLAVNAISLTLMAILVSCSPATTQKITAINSGGFITVSGSGFSHIKSCAQLSVIGFPPPNAVLGMGKVNNCSAGVFTNFSWRFNQITTPGALQGCQITATQQAVVTAVDLGNSQTATKTIQVGTGPNCSIICGTIGQPACPAGCLTGVNNNPGRNGTCVPCGGEGQSPCPGNVCATGLHLNGTGNVVCTANCGNVNQSPCVTSGSAQGVTFIYHCYSGSTIEASGGCVCIPDTNSNPCQEVNSGGTGECLPVARIPAGCN